MVDGIESVTPKRGWHDYLLLLLDEAFLNGEFLADVPVVL